LGCVGKRKIAGQKWLPLGQGKGYTAAMIKTVTYSETRRRRTCA